MHPTKPVLRHILPIIILILALADRAGHWARAADEPAPPPKREEPAALRGNAVTVPIGGSQRLQMRGKKIIKLADNRRDNVATVQPIVDDPTSVLISGKEAGTTRITLTATDGTEETYEVIVQLDIELLRSVLQRAVPKASIQLIPSAGGAIIITGSVEHADDIDTIIRTAQAAVPGRDPTLVINAMRVGGVMQVQLDVVVAFVSRNELRRMSFDFFTQGQHHIFNNGTGGATILPTPGTTILHTFVGQPGIVNTIGSPNGAPANLFLGLFNNEEDFFGLLQALRDETLVKIEAEPKLTTLSGRSATIVSGGEQAIPEAQGLGSVSVAFRTFGTVLSFLPVVLGDGRIHLEVEPEVSILNNAAGVTINGTFVPGRSVQRVHTTVEVEDGQTFAIGGLIQRDTNANDSKVPVLGDLPFIGVAFSRKEFSETETELLVIVTPHLVDPMSCDQLPKLLPGQETRTPDDFELFLEGILEAPRGAREVFPNHRYKPAYQNGPTAGVYPCAPDNGCCKGLCGRDGCGHGNCAGGNCVNGGCATGACGGSGLAEVAPIGYSGGVPGSVEIKPVAHPATLQGAARLPAGETDTAAGSHSAGAATPASAKPAALPAVFGPTGYDDQK